MISFSRSVKNFACFGDSGKTNRARIARRMVGEPSTINRSCQPWIDVSACSKPYASAEAKQLARAADDMKRP